MCGDPPSELSLRHGHSGFPTGRADRVSKCVGCRGCYDGTLRWCPLDGGSPPSRWARRSPDRPDPRSPRRSVEAVAWQRSDEGLEARPGIGPRRGRARPVSPRRCAVTHLAPTITPRAPRHRWSGRSLPRRRASAPSSGSRGSSSRSSSRRARRARRVVVIAYFLV